MSSGFASANYFTAQYLTPMRKAGYIAQVGEANPHSPRLEYKITAKGRREIANGQATPPLPTPPKGSPFAFKVRSRGLSPHGSRMIQSHQETFP